MKAANIVFNGTYFNDWTPTLGNAVAAGVKREKERPPVNWKDQGEKT